MVLILILVGTEALQEPGDRRDKQIFILMAKDMWEGRDEGGCVQTSLSMLFPEAFPRTT